MSESYAFSTSSGEPGAKTPLIQAEVQPQGFAEMPDMTWEDAKLKAQEFLAEAETYVKENPGKAVLTAMGVGFVLGLMFRR